MKELSLENYKIVLDETSGKISEISDKENSLKLSGSIWEVETADKEFLTIDDMESFSFSIEDKIILIWQKGDFKVIINFFCEDDKLKSNISVFSYNSIFGLNLSGAFICRVPFSTATTFFAPVPSPGGSSCRKKASTLHGNATEVNPMKPSPMCSM